MSPAIPLPKFFIELSPKRIESGVPTITVKSPKLSLTSGGNTGMPMRLPSATITPTVSTSPDSAVSTAAMYSTGKFAFMYAVW